MALKKEIILTQKHAGLILIVFGLFLAGAITPYIIIKNQEIDGFPELLPASETVVYVETPAQLTASMYETIQKRFNVSWEKDIAPLSSGSVAVAFLKNNESDSKALLPVMFLNTAAPENSATFLKKYRNPTEQVQTIQYKNTTVYSTQQLHFSFLENTVVISSSAQALYAVLDEYEKTRTHLGADRAFIKIRRGTPGEFFAYIDEAYLPPGIAQYIQTIVPRTPPLAFSLGKIGIGATNREKQWKGSSYILLREPILLERESSYRASLLSLIPRESEVILAGQNLESQLKKISQLMKKNVTLMNEIFDVLGKEYLPGIDARSEISPLVEKEFAFSSVGSQHLFISEVDENKVADSVAKLERALVSIRGNFTPKTRDVTLPDGTSAQELIPDPSAAGIVSENFNDITIKGISFGVDRGVLYAVTQGKFFVSNSMTTLKKALSLIKQPGENFRESEGYQKLLQPILKNPEFLGVVHFDSTTFSFSKRTFADHLETQFVWLPR